MNKFELHLKYKSDTANEVEPVTAMAFMNDDFDVVLDSSEYIDERILQQLPADNSGKEQRISFPDPDYHKWIEEKLMELLKV